MESNDILKTIINSHKTLINFDYEAKQFNKVQFSAPNKNINIICNITPYSLSKFHEFIIEKDNPLLYSGLTDVLYYLNNNYVSSYESKLSFSYDPKFKIFN